VELYVTARDSKISDEMKEYIKDKLARLEKLSHKIVDVHVVMDFQRYLYIVEVNINTNLAKIIYKEADADMFAAIDTAVDKLERQMRKIKERIQNHHSKINSKIAVSELPAGEKEADDEFMETEDVIEEEITVKTMDLQSAVNHLDVLHDPFIIFIKSDNKRKNILCKSSETKYELFEWQEIAGKKVLVEYSLDIIKSETGIVKSDIAGKKELEINSITVAQATEKLKAMKKEFLVFQNTLNNGNMNMVFYRKDGKFGLIKIEQ